MALAPQTESELPTAGPPSSEPKDVLRLVCGWNEKTNTYLYRDEVVNPPPIYGNGPEKAETEKAERVKKRPKRATTPNLRNASARGREMEKLRSERAGWRGKKASPHQQPSPASTPASESGHWPRRKRAPSQSVNSDKQLYAVPDYLQGTVRPVPTSENSDEMLWTDMENTTVPLPEDPAVKIGEFDNIMVTLVSPENRNPHNQPAKVLDCRLHPDGTYFLLVSWWFERRALSKNLVGFKRYLDRRWPADEPFKFVLGCHFDVITNDAISEKMTNDERFCKFMVYGGVYHNWELFSDVPDEIERRDRINNGVEIDARLMEEETQKSMFRMLLRSETNQERKDLPIGVQQEDSTIAPIIESELVSAQKEAVIEVDKVPELGRDSAAQMTGPRAPMAQMW